MQGTIERIVTDRAFGFLKGDEDRKEYFFHRSSASNFYDLREGDKVSFEPTDSDKGLRAEQVSLSQEAVP